MAVLIDYIWQSTFCLLFFFGVYFVFLRNEKAFTVNRFYILITPVLALLFPLISIPVSFDKPGISLEQTEFYRALSEQEAPDNFVATFGLPEVIVQSSKLPLLWEIRDYIFLAYLSVILFLSFKLFLNFIQLRMIWEKGWYQTIYNLKENYFLIPTFGLAPVFSYFNKLFWDDTHILKDDEKEQIIKHEIEHIRQGHSWDVMYYQILSILFWFNPVIHLMRAELIDVHEYLADENVIRKTINKENYPKLIVKMAFKGIDLPIGNYFIRSTTLKRIMMMKNPKKINWLKTVMVFPLSLTLLALVSMKTERGEHLLPLRITENIEEIKKMLLVSQDSLEVGIKVKKIKNPLHYEFISPRENENLTAQIGELQYEFTGINSDEEYIKVRGLINNLRSTSKITKSYPNARFKYQVDSPAEPTMGMEEWNKAITQQIKVPQMEKDLGLGGVIEIEFVVSKEGEIQNPIVKRSYGGGLDDQLLEAVQKESVNKWIAAKSNEKPVDMVMTASFAFYGSAMSATDSHQFFNPSPTPALNSNFVVTENTVFDVVEKAPEFEGGMKAWNEWIKSNIQYPNTAKQMGVEGTVYVVFVINKDGTVDQPEILRGIGAGCDEEVLRLISEMPDWIPGEQRGQKVNVRMRLPVRFKLPSDQVVSGNLFDENPQSQGGNPKASEAFNSHMAKNLKYPAESRENEVFGTVFTKVHLDADGKINSYAITKGVSPELDNEVLRVIENAPNWTVDGKENSYIVNLPITFRIAGGENTLGQILKVENEIVVTGYGAQDRSPFSKIKMYETKENHSSEPIFVIDGVAHPEIGRKLDDIIKPDQIKSIEVVKGEKAFSMIDLYGSRVQNGVILITTKK
ncbi:TonB family C-terminal domain-containing protein [Aquiflexum balticum DSM 16537]|uniref:TonB family C-terminal domain-containing protein n=1 Tax=Aquiflexum balticum DSM 16537 TaxID=758820 RepID=A0A1W2H8S4_9BACT|nr:M56 family metallopeptidase [Aquiflexum balticum]SMD45194.1 TonB family C-terminal domain-containing protein [Aquiflexum balticum DSM 16537]